MCLWHFLSNILQEHTEPLSLLGSIFPTRCPHSTLCTHSKPHCTPMMSSETSKATAAWPKTLVYSCRLSQTIWSVSQAAVLRFSRVSRVLSSVFPPALSCSLTSEHKQEALHRADTSLQPYMRGHSLRIERQRVTGSLCPFVS